VLVGTRLLSELADHPGEVRRVRAAGVGAALAVVEVLPQGGFLFAAQSAQGLEERRASLVRVAVVWGGIVLGTLLLIVFLISRSLLTGPIQRLVQSVGMVAAGEADEVGSAIDDEDLGVLRETLRTMAYRIQEDRRHIQEQVSRLESINHELVATQEKLIRTEKLASVGQLAAGMAHEIGNPIGVILGYLELLRDGRLGQEHQAKAVQQIRESVDRVDSIIKDLLNYSRPALDEETSSYAVATVQEIFALLKPQKRFRNVQLEMTGESGGDVQVAIPPSRFKQVLVNLLLNAADAMGGQGRVVVSIEDSQYRVSLAVADTGPGIPEEHRLKLFDPFFTTKPAGEGTGLGLFVCHTIVNRYYGRMEVANRDEGGAVFTLHLRRHTRQEPGREES
jgi:signal transduction histidine kinase